MRRALLLLALTGTVTTGCASTNTGRLDQGTSVQAEIYRGADAPTILAERPRAVSQTFSAPEATVWNAVKRVYAELDVPVMLENRATHQLGNVDFYKTRQFVGKAMTEFIDCGGGITGPYAASYRIYMSLLTTVIPDGKGGTAVATTMTAAAKDMAGGSADRIVCAPNGRFESLFLERVKAAIGS